MSFTAAAASTPGTARSCGPPPGGEMWRGWCLVNYGIQSRGLIFHDTLISCSLAWCPAADAVATLATFYYSCRSHEVRKCHVSRVTRGGRVTRVPALFCHHLGTRHQYTSHFYLGLTGVEEVRLLGLNSRLLGLLRSMFLLVLFPYFSFFLSDTKEGHYSVEGSLLVQA